MTENETKPKRSKLKIALVIVGVLVLISALSNLLNGRDPEPDATASSSEAAVDEAEDDAEPEDTDADADSEAEPDSGSENEEAEDEEAKPEDEEPEDEKAEPEDEEGDATDASGFEIENYDLGDELPGGETTVAFDLSDNLTQGMWASVAESDTCDAIEAGFEAYPDSGRVVAVGSYPMTDKYGNEDDTVVLRASYDADTYDKINMDNCRYIDVWDLRDGGQIHPDLLANR